MVNGPLGASLVLNFVDIDLGLCCSVMRNRQVVAIQFWHEDSGLGAETAGEPREQSIMVSVLLRKNIQELITG